MTRIALASLLVALLLTLPAAAQDHRPALDPHAVTCTNWNGSKASPLRAAYSAWVFDYITNHDAEPDRDYYAGQIDLTDGVTSEDLSRWMDGYCAAHAGDNLQAAAAALVGDLGTRWVTSHSK